MEGVKRFAIGWMARPLWLQQTLSAIGTILLLLLLLPPSSSRAREHLLSATNKALPERLTDYEIPDASSQCACRVMCIRNYSCTGVTVEDNGAQMTCTFSHEKVFVGDLSSNNDANTWLFNAIETTTTQTISTTTAPTTTTTTSSTASTTTTTTTTPSTTTTSATTPTTTTATTTRVKGCQENFHLLNESCYYFNCSKTWQNARSTCVSLGGDLAKITSYQENEFIQSSITSEHWFGLNDIANEGSFVWSVDNSSLVSGSNYTRWASNQPSNHNNQDCVKIQNSDGSWNDSDCNNSKCYVCQKPAS